MVKRFPDLDDRTMDNILRMAQYINEPMSAFEPEDVMVIDDVGFEKITAEDQVTLISYHSETCGPATEGRTICDTMEQVYSDLAKHVLIFEGQIRLASVNCDKWSTICNTANVTNFPTYVPYRNGKEVTNGEESARDSGEKSLDRFLADVYHLLLSEFGRPTIVRELPDRIITDPYLPSIVVTLGGVRQGSSSGNTDGVLHCKDILDQLDQPMAKCWEFDAATDSCLMKEECLELDCHSNKMSGFVDAAVFNDPNLVDELSGLLLREVRFQSAPSGDCTPKIDYSEDRRGFTFTLPLGECGMQSTTVTTGDVGEILFTEYVDFLAQLTNTFADGFNGRFQLQCRYPAVASTKHDFDTKVEKFEYVSGKEGSWNETFNINFYQSDSYTIEIKPDQLYIGQYIYARVFPTDSFSGSFPIDFYLDQCVISSSDNRYSFNLIENGCLSSLVKTELHSDGPYQQQEIRLSFVSFAFVQQRATYAMSIQCDITLCLQEDIAAGRCGLGKQTNCPAGYFPSVIN